MPSKQKRIELIIYCSILVIVIFSYILSFLEPKLAIHRIVIYILVTLASVLIFARKKDWKYANLTFVGVVTLAACAVTLTSKDMTHISAVLFIPTSIAAILLASYKWSVLVATVLFISGLIGSHFSGQFVQPGYFLLYVILTALIIFTQVLLALYRKELEAYTKQLENAMKILEKKYQFEKDMMGIMGHELRTPLTVAKGITELMISKFDMGKEMEIDYIKSKIYKIHQSLVKEAGLVQVLLSSSHLDHNKIELNITNVDLYELARYSVTAYRKEAKIKGIKLIFQKPDFDIPIIMNDVDRCQEIISNLVSNAVKYTNKGSVTVSFTKTKKYIYVNIVDTGIGMPKNEIANLGKKFYRIRQYIDNEKDIVRAGGTGLGLYVVKGLLEAMGGELKVTSEIGKGSTFSAVFKITPSTD